MTKPIIRFNFETCSPGELIALEVRLADACIERRRFREWSTRDEVPEDRAIELLLHWWGAGHDPKRRPWRPLRHSPPPQGQLVELRLCNGRVLRTRECAPHMWGVTHWRPL